MGWLDNEYDIPVGGFRGGGGGHGGVGMGGFRGGSGGGLTAAQLAEFGPNYTLNMMTNPSPLDGAPDGAIPTGFAPYLKTFAQKQKLFEEMQHFAAMARAQGIEPPKNMPLNEKDIEAWFATVQEALEPKTGAAGSLDPRGRPYLSWTDIDPQTPYAQWLKQQNAMGSSGGVNGIGYGGFDPAPQPKPRPDYNFDIPRNAYSQGSADPMSNYRTSDLGGGGYSRSGSYDEYSRPYDPYAYDPSAYGGSSTGGSSSRNRMLGLAALGGLAALWPGDVLAPGRDFNPSPTPQPMPPIRPNQTPAAPPPPPISTPWGSGPVASPTPQSTATPDRSAQSAAQATRNAESPPPSQTDKLYPTVVAAGQEDSGFAPATSTPVGMAPTQPAYIPTQVPMPPQPTQPPQPTMVPMPTPFGFR
jgi:hypothetical protein